MLNRLAFWFAVFAFLAPGESLCQASPVPQSSPAHMAEATQFYKLSFSLRELDEGKIVNQRAFVMMVCSDGTWYSLRAGSKIPIPGTKETNYSDVGVNLDVRPMDGSDTAVPVFVKAEISSVGIENPPSAPPIRQVQVRTSSLLPLGKATTVFTADDPSSKHHFELDATATRQK